MIISTAPFARVQGGLPVGSNPSLCGGHRHVSHGYSLQSWLTRAGNFQSVARLFTTAA